MHFMRVDELRRGTLTRHTGLSRRSPFCHAELVSASQYRRRRIMFLTNNNDPFRKTFGFPTLGIKLLLQSIIDVFSFEET